MIRSRKPRRSFLRFALLALALGLGLGLAAIGTATTPDAPPTRAVAPAHTAEDVAIPPGPRFYKGREIARTMHYSGAEWLIRENRENEERCSKMLAELGIEPGMTICDMGCGNGFYSLPIARDVGPEGRVLCVDIQPEMLESLRDRAERASAANIVPILGTVIDPKLPEGAVDLILCVDVYHELSHPEPMLAAMRRSLKEDGLLVLVEYRAEDPSVPIKKLHKMSKKQILKELVPNGFELVREFDGLPWQHMMFFGRDDRDEAGAPSADEPERGVPRELGGQRRDS